MLDGKLRKAEKYLDRFGSIILIGIGIKILLIIYHKVSIDFLLLFGQMLWRYSCAMSGNNSEVKLVQM